MLAIAVVIAFAGNGLSASSITRPAERWALVRTALLIAWLILTVPVARALVQDRRVQFLKTLPVPGAHLLAIIGALLLVAESPWVLLWARGSGAVAALAAGLVAMALHTSWLVRPSSWAARAGFLTTLALWLSGSPWGTILGASVTFPLGLLWAWRSSPSEASARAWPVKGPVALALGSVHVATMIRAHAAIVARCLLLTLAAATCAVLAVRNNEIRQVSHLTRLVESIYIPLALAPLVGLAGPLLRGERNAAWVLDVAAVSGRQRRVAMALALFGMNELLAVVYVTVMVGALRFDFSTGLRLLTEVSLLGGLVVVVASRVARFALRDGGRDSARLILGMLGLTVAAVASLQLDIGGAVSGWLIIAMLCVGAPERHELSGEIGRPRSPKALAVTEGTAMLLSLSKVRKVLGGRPVLDGVDLIVESGDVVRIHGENGAGKSTLLRVTSGLVRADGGTFVLGDANLARSSVRYKAQLGYIPDTTDAFPELRAGEYLSLVQALKAASVASTAMPSQWLERLGVNEFLGQTIATLSFGQRKRLYTAAALIGDPWLLVFDEPSNGLDPIGVELVTELIRARAGRGQATLCATNDLAFAEQVGGTGFVLADGALQRQHATTS